VPLRRTIGDETLSVVAPAHEFPTAIGVLQQAKGGRKSLTLAGVISPSQAGR
jgi:hypothetical protein